MPKMNTQMKMKMKPGVQLTLPRTGGIGGPRKGAGRKVPPGKRRQVPHRKRARLDGKNHPGARDGAGQTCRGHTVTPLRDRPCVAA